MRCQTCHKKLERDHSPEVGPEGKVLCVRCYWKTMHGYWKEYERQAKEDVRLSPTNSD